MPRGNCANDFKEVAVVAYHSWHGDFAFDAGAEVVFVAGFGLVDGQHLHVGTPCQPSRIGVRITPTSAPQRRGRCCPAGRATVSFRFASQPVLPQRCNSGLVARHGVPATPLLPWSSDPCPRLGRKSRPRFRLVTLDRPNSVRAAHKRRRTTLKLPALGAVASV